MSQLTSRILEGWISDLKGYVYNTRADMIPLFAEIACGLTRHNREGETLIERIPVDEDTADTADRLESEFSWRCEDASDLIERLEAKWRQLKQDEEA